MGKQEGCPGEDGGVPKPACGLANSRVCVWGGRESYYCVLYLLLKEGGRGGSERAAETERTEGKEGEERTEGKEGVKKFSEVASYSVGYFLQRAVLPPGLLLNSPNWSSPNCSHAPGCSPTGTREGVGKCRSLPLKLCNGFPLWN